MMVDFFDDWDLNKWWKRKLAGLGVTKKNTRFGLHIGTCAVCGRVDYVFPSGELRVTGEEYEKMKDNGAKIDNHWTELIPEGYRSDLSGKRTYIVHHVQTYICNKCTRKIAEQARKNREDIRKKIGARKIA